MNAKKIAEYMLIPAIAIYILYVITVMIRDKKKYAIEMTTMQTIDEAAKRSIEKTTKRKRFWQ